MTQKVESKAVPKSTGEIQKDLVDVENPRWSLNKEATKGATKEELQNELQKELQSRSYKRSYKEGVTKGATKQLQKVQCWRLMYNPKMTWF